MPGSEAAGAASDSGASEPGAGEKTRTPRMEWAEHHRPRLLDELVGNRKAFETMRSWAKEWQSAPPKTRALVLEGPPGIGKTSSAHALAHEMGWDLIELNASDARSAPVIMRVAGTGAVTSTFTSEGTFRSAAEGGRTLIVLDEADNLFERGGKAATSGQEDLSDRGGKRAIVETIRNTRQPVILIVNDLYALMKGSGAALRPLTMTVKFSRPQSRSIAKRLADVLRKEGGEADPEALVRIAEASGGDMRAAVNDLQAAFRPGERLQTRDVVGLGSRDTQRTMFQVLPDIFKSMDLDKARKATWDLDEDPEFVSLWVAQNLGVEYKRPDDLARGYQMLSRADVFLGRVRRRQYYALWGYASELMTGGVAVAKSRPYPGYTRWEFPSWLRRMSSSRAKRQLRDNLALKIGRHLHTSKREARLEYIAPLSYLFKADEELVVHLGADLLLSKEELAFLLDDKPTLKRVKDLHEKIRKEVERRPAVHAGVWADDEDVALPPEEAATPTAKPEKKKASSAKKAAGEDDGASKKRAAKKRGKQAAEKEDDEEDSRPQAQGQKGLFDF